MKLIHCADLHLDSSMESVFRDREMAERRRGELLAAFVRLVSFAEENRAAAVLIAGDLFDRRRISAGTGNAVLDAMEEHPAIHFFYLRGNHDPDVFESEDGIPENLHLFGDEWGSYAFEGSKVRISGLELCPGNAAGAAAALSLRPEDFNIVMLHGQIAGYPSPDRAETIALQEYRGRDIDYLALGHVHQHQEGVLDPRGIYVYPGCLEGRGFDETGEHGFELLELNEKTGRFSHRFVPSASRKIALVKADCSGLKTSGQIAERVRETAMAQGCGPGDLVKAVLEGSAGEDMEKNPEVIRMLLEESFCEVRVEDRMSLQIRFEDYRHDATLRGEFVRLVEAAPDLSGEEKAQIVRCGLKALAGQQED